MFQTLGSVFILRPAASSLSSLMKLSAPAALALSLPLCVSLCGSPSFFALAQLLEENREREGPGQHTDFPFVRLPHPTPPHPSPSSPSMTSPLEFFFFLKTRPRSVLCLFWFSGMLTNFLHVFSLFSLWHFFVTEQQAEVITEEQF